MYLNSLELSKRTNRNKPGAQMEMGLIIAHRNSGEVSCLKYVTICLHTGMDNLGSVRSGPVQCVGPTFFEMESDRTDRRLNLDRTDFRPIQKELGPTDRSGPCLTIGPNRSVGPI